MIALTVALLICTESLGASLKISICHCQKDLGHCAFVLSLHHLLTGAITYTRNASRGACSCCNYNKTLAGGRPHRLVVRTSRCGRDNPGSTPGEGNLNRERCLRTRVSLFAPRVNLGGSLQQSRSVTKTLTLYI